MCHSRGTQEHGPLPALGLMLVIVLVVFVAVTAIARFAPGNDLYVASSVLPFPGGPGDER